MNRLEPLVEQVETALRSTAAETAGNHLIYQIIEYHLGWRDQGLWLVEGQAGKRTRGVLTLLCARAAGGSGVEALSAAAAIELVHNLSLIYDDIQDESHYRRGRPTVWSLWGVAQTINVGVALQAMIACALAGPTQFDALLVTQATIQTLAEGQHDDLALESGTLAPTPEAYLTMAGKKTGALMGAAAYLGARSVGADRSRTDAYRRFGFHLGVAYQLLDDVHGIWGDPSGQKPAEDLVRRKKTFPVCWALDRVPADLKRVFVNGPWSDTCPEIAAMRLLLDDCKAREQTIAQVQVEARAAADALGQAGPLPHEAVHLFALLESILGLTVERF